MSNLLGQRTEISELGESFRLPCKRIDVTKIKSNE